ncbi:hypothetical protein WUBG_10219 [Wuchereria bancrofti]|uniref:Uncharacterized protein n=1 Tax=Wuchereria bancrofti TaxID=6293 RepID=J9EP84_WUCBA|nr:hypothetical protein WUBG_10219 [Wuchereria bancrofti]
MKSRQYRVNYVDQKPNCLFQKLFPHYRQDYYVNEVYHTEDPNHTALGRKISGVVNLEKEKLLAKNYELCRLIEISMKVERFTRQQQQKLDRMKGHFLIEESS